MYCSNCGKERIEKAKFCQSCGSEFERGAAITTESNLAVQPRKAGRGFAITGIVLGSIALAVLFVDFALIGSGLYEYVLPEEIGFLILVSVLGLVFSILSLLQKHKLATLATVLTGSALFLTFALATYM
jgi:hypothetical protein